LKPLSAKEYLENFCPISNLFKVSYFKRFCSYWSRLHSICG